MLLGSYVLWRVVSVDAWALAEWPLFIYPQFGYLYPPNGFEWVLVAEKWLLLAFACTFLVGYRTRVSAFFTSLLLGHLTTVMMAMNHSGETQQMAIGSLLVLLFGLYAEQDKISIDALRETRHASMTELNDTLKGSVKATYPMQPFKWAILLVAILYAGAPWFRAVQTGLGAWMAPESLARWTTYFLTILRSDPFLGVMLVESPLLLQLGTWGTILVEMSLLLFVPLGLSVTPIIFLLLGLHFMIFATMQIFFFDMFFFLLLFVAFDRGYARVVTDRKIDLVYDERCFFCARSLYLFKFIDINETVTFYTQSTAPAQYRNRDGVDFEDRMYVFIDDSRYGGYWAFRELLRQFWFPVPLAWIMNFSPVAAIGERVYQYVANNRSRYFVCSVEES